MIIDGVEITTEYEFSGFIPGSINKRGLKNEPDIEEDLVIIQTNPESHEDGYNEKVLKMCWERVRELQEEMSYFRDDS